MASDKEKDWCRQYNISVRLLFAFCLLALQITHIGPQYLPSVLIFVVLTLTKLIHQTKAAHSRLTSPCSCSMIPLCQWCWSGFVLFWTVHCLDLPPGCRITERCPTGHVVAHLSNASQAEFSCLGVWSEVSSADVRIRRICLSCTSLSLMQLHLIWSSSTPIFQHGSTDRARIVTNNTVEASVTLRYPIKPD